MEYTRVYYASVNRNIDSIRALTKREAIRYFMNKHNGALCTVYFFNEGNRTNVWNTTEEDSS